VGTMAAAADASTVRSRWLSGVTLGGVVLSASALAAWALATRDTPLGPVGTWGGTLYSSTD